MTATGDLFRFASRAYGDAPAIVDLDAGIRLTFTDLGRWAVNLAHDWFRAGLEPGDRVAVMMGNGAEHLVVDVALAMAGLAKVVLPVQAPAAMLAACLRITEPAGMVAEEEFERVLGEVGLPLPRSVLDVGELGLRLKRAPAEVDGARAANLGADALGASRPHMFRFTSGTTGDPKAVVHDGRGWRAMILQQLLRPNWGDYISPGTRFLQVVALESSIFWAHSSIVGGATTYLTRSIDDVEWLADMVGRQRITATFAAPPVIVGLLDHAPTADALSSLETVFFAGAQMQPTDFRRARAALGDVFVHFYAASEYPVCTITTRRGFYGPNSEQADYEARPHATTCGRPSLGTEVRLLDEAGAEVAEGQIGELAIRGEHAFVGYWGNDEATRRAIRPDGFVRLGDLAHIDAGGWYYLAGRREDRATRGGTHVMTGAVEMVIARHTDVAEVAVVRMDRPDDVGDELVAVVVKKPGSRLAPGDILAACQEVLSAAEVPEKILVREEPLPKSPVGKVMKKAVVLELVADR